MVVIKLNFNEINVHNEGKSNNLVHFWDNQVQIFYLKDGQLFTKISRIYNGQWDDLEFIGERRLLNNETGIKEIRLSSVFGNAVIGSYINEDNEQKMFVYEY